MENIPKEIYSLIVSFLDDASRRSMRLASTQWFNIIKYDSFNFYYTTEEQFKGICNRLKKYSFPIGVRFSGSQMDFEKRHYDMLGQITQLTRLTGEYIIKYASREDLWALTKLTNLEDIFGEVPAAIKARLPNLKSMGISTQEEIQVSKTLSQLESIVFTTTYNEDLLKFIEESLQVLPNPLKLTQIISIGNPSKSTLNSMNEHLTKLSNLQELALVANSWAETSTPLSNSWNVPALPNLKLLVITKLENVQSISPSNTKLTKLHLTGGIIDCSIFVPLPNLVNLRLSGTFRHLSDLGLLPKLKNLTVSIKNYSSELMAEMQFLSKLTNLEVFEIGSFDGQRSWSESLQYFSVNNNLTEMHLSGFNNSFGKHMTRFHKLQILNCNHLTPQSARYLTALTSLTKLYGINTMTPEKFANIDSLTALKHLHFSVGLEEANSDKFTKLHFGKFLNLEDLKISSERNTNVSSITLDGFNELSHLTKLTIEWPVITKSFLEEISQCTSLANLSIRADVSDEAILPLTSLTSLKHLIITRESYAFMGVNLTCLTSLRVLNVYHSGTLAVTKETLKQKLPNLRSCII